MEKQGEPGHRRDGEQDLEAAPEQEPAAGAHDVLDGQLQPHGEQQEHHADLGKPLHRVRFGDEPRAVRPDEHAGDQEAHERRQPYLVEQKGDGQRDREQDDQFAQYGDLVFGHGIIIA